MHNRRHPVFPLTAALLAITLLAGGYMGAYYSMLVGKRLLGFPLASSTSPSLQFVPKYRTNNRLIAGALVPANVIDRRLRPTFWSEPRSWDELKLP